jgi:hypothetical protein
MKKGGEKTMNRKKKKKAEDRKSEEIFKIEEIIKKPQLDCAYTESAWACEDRPCW